MPKKSPMKKVAKELRKHLKKWRAKNPNPSWANRQEVYKTPLSWDKIALLDPYRLSKEEREFYEAHEAAHEAMSKAMLKPVDQFWMHELVDRSELLSDMFSKNIAEHIENDAFKNLKPEIRTLVKHIEKKLGKLYQMAALEHLNN